MDKPRREARGTGAFWGCIALGGLAVASSLVMASGGRLPTDVGRAAIKDYVVSVEVGDRDMACEHATRAAHLYQKHGETSVGEGWRSIATNVCAQRPQQAAASRAAPV